MATDFRVLGPLEVWCEGTRLDLGGPRRQKLLAALLLEVGRVVSPGWLANVVWDGNPPPTGLRQVYKHVHALRQEWSRACTDPGDQIIATIGAGYRLTIQAGRLDAHRFEEQVARAGRLRSSGRKQEAAAGLRAALTLWRGPAFAGVAHGALRAAVDRLDERCLAVREECLDLELELGRHTELVPELTSLVAEHPFRERLVERLMLALYRSGRQTDALDVYRRLRWRMTTEQGVDPAGYLRWLHEAMLRQDPEVESVRVGAESTWTGPTAAYLPMGLPSFTGRDDQLAALDSLLDKANTVVISAIAGAGKTALAVHWAHRVRDRFPDGQLYVDLRGYDREPPMGANEALEVFLRALGTPAERVPIGPDEQAGMYRSLLAGRRVLIVLDNAAAVEQVRPLLPGAAGCLVLVTSRDALRGLALHDARRIPLDMLSKAEAHRLLCRVLGDERVAAERDAAFELARLCGFLPLALRIAAANLAAQPHQRIADAVAALAGGDRLGQLTLHGDPRATVHATFDLSYRMLPPDARGLLKAFGLLQGPDLTVPVAAALLGRPVAEARQVLAVLETTHLVCQYLPHRYRLHDLVRLYAHVQAMAEDRETDRVAAVVGLLEYYVTAVDAAVALLNPDSITLPRPDAPPTTPLEVFADDGTALAWLHTECPNLIAAIVLADELGLDVLCTHLVDALRGFFWLRKCTSEWLFAAEIGLAAARRTKDSRLQAAMHGTLGLAKYSVAHYAESIGHSSRVLAIGVDLGSSDTQIAALFGLASSYLNLGRLAEAADFARRAVRLADRVDGRPKYALALGARGRVAREIGRLAPAGEDFTAALAIHRETGNRDGEVFCLSQLGQVHLETGDHRRSLELLQAACEVFGDSGDRALEATVLAWLAAVRRISGEHGRALDLADQALKLSRDIDRPVGEVAALTELSRVHRAHGELDTAASLADQAVDLAGQMGLRLYLGRARHARAETTFDLGRYPEARAQAVEALAVHREVGQRLREADDLLFLARTSRYEGRQSDADRYARLAADICGEVAGERAADVLRTMSTAYAVGK